MGFIARAVEGVVKGLDPKTHRLLILAAFTAITVVVWHAVDVVGGFAANIALARVEKDGSLELQFRGSVAQK